MRDYNFIKSLLVTNNISNIPGKKGLLFAEGVGHEVRRGMAFRMRKLKGCCPGLNLGEWECPSRWQRWRWQWRGGGGEVVPHRRRWV